MTHAALRGLAPCILTSMVGLLAGCGSSPHGEGDVGATASALSSNEQAAYQFFIGKGLKNFQAAGIVGNLQQESSVNPAVAQYGGGPGRGIAQWSTGGRWDADHDDNVAWYAAEQHASEYSLTLQLEFVWYELETFSGYGLASLRASTSVSGATVAFQNDFEGCGTCDESTRIEYAEQVLAAYGGGSSGSGSGGSSSGGSGCYSDTLGKTMADNACVQSKSNSDWYQCDGGSWVDRWTDPTACSGVYPLEAEQTGGCYSGTLGKTMPDNACVQSKYDHDWYQCSSGTWDDRWTDPNACDGTYPL